MPEDSQQDENKPECGIGRCKLKSATRLADVRVFLAAMCLMGVFQGSFAGYSASHNTTLERRFSIGSFLIGCINSCFEIGSIICGLLLTYFSARSSRTHVPRLVSFGLLSIAIGAFIFSSPYFMMPPSSEGSPSTGFIVILFIAQFFIGTGSSPILTLAPAFVDQHVDPSRSPPMIASLYAASAMGPVFGFALGTLMHNLPENLVMNDTVRVGEPKFVPAWWLGYMILGVLELIGAFILFTFPKRLRRVGPKPHSPKSLRVMADQDIFLHPNSTDGVVVASSNGAVNSASGSDPVTLAQSSNSSNSTGNQQHNSKRNISLPRAIFHLLCNKVYMVTTCIIVCEMFGVIGFGMFAPKYLEKVYQISPIKASLSVGCLVLPCGALGIIAGGFVSRGLARQRKCLACVLVAISGMTIICQISFLFFGCATTPVAGLNAPYPINVTTRDYTLPPRQKVVTAGLITEKKCDLNDWTAPICHVPTRITYISACFGECTGDVKSSTLDCKLTGDKWPQQYEEGLCQPNCNNFYLFLTIMVVVLFLMGMVQNPLIMITMRSVERDNVSFALATQFAFMRIFAYVPSAIVYGKVMDLSCELWKRVQSQAGDCLFTNREIMMDNLTALAASFKSASFVFYIVLYLLIRRSLPKEKSCFHRRQTSITNSLKDDQQQQPQQQTVYYQVGSEFEIKPGS